MEISDFVTIGLVAGFFLLGFVSAGVWYRRKLVKQYEDFCDKIDEACDKVAKYYEDKFKEQAEKQSSEKPEEKEIIEQYRDWLKTQYTKRGTITAKICFVKRVLIKCQSDKYIYANERAAMRQFNKWLGIETGDENE